METCAASGLINDYLVADEATPATVNIIDPAGEPAKSSRDFVFRSVGWRNGLLVEYLGMGLYLARTRLPISS